PGGRKGDGPWARCLSCRQLAIAGSGLKCRSARFERGCFHPAKAQCVRAWLCGPHLFRLLPWVSFYWKRVAANNVLACNAPCNRLVTENNMPLFDLIRHQL